MCERTQLKVGHILRKESGRLGAAPWPPPGPPLVQGQWAPGPEGGHLQRPQHGGALSSKRMYKLERAPPSHPRHPSSLASRSGWCGDLLCHLLDRPDALHLLIAHNDLPDGV